MGARGLKEREKGSVEMQDLDHLDRRAAAKRVTKPQISDV
jgi:hypothetical protein